MTTIDPETLRRELLLEQEINRRLDPLVRQASAAVVLLKGNDRMEVSQLRNLLNTAVETGSLEVVVNFIRYQIARNQQAWGAGPQDFGQRVITDLRGPVHALAQETATAVGTQAGTTERLAAESFGRMMTLYLGYLNRAFYYAKRTGKFEDLEAING